MHRDRVSGCRAKSLLHGVMNSVIRLSGRKCGVDRHFTEKKPKGTVP